MRVHIGGDHAAYELQLALVEPPPGGAATR